MEKSPPPTPRIATREEYEIQLFGFTSRDVGNGLMGRIKEELQCTIDDLCNHLLKSAKSKSSEIQAAGNSLKQDYKQAMEEMKDELQVLIDGYFLIPKHVLLPEDAAQKNQYTVNHVETTDRETEELLKREKRVSYMKASLTKEKAVLDELENMQAYVKNVENILLSSTKHLELWNEKHPSLQTLVNEAAKSEKLQKCIHSPFD